jgi:ribonucleoside-triphosphate reductase
MGYFRPVAFFNVGKKGEFHERVEFVEPNCGCLS